VIKRELKILSLSCVFPTPAEPGHGLFVKSRLQYMAELAQVRVVAPLPMIDYGHPERQFFKGFSVPYRRTEGGLDVIHPRWLYPPLGGSFNAFCLYRQLVRTLRLLRNDYAFQIIDSHHGHPDGTAAALLASELNCPFSVTLRGNEPKLAESGRQRQAMTWAFKNAACVISVSENLRQFAISLGVDPARTRTIPNGIDSTMFFPRDMSESRKKYGIPEDVLVVLSAGSLCERKGHHRVVRALKSISAHVPRTLLLIAGGPSREGQYENEIRRVVAESNMETGVRFLGHLNREAIAEVMSASDIFCLASRQEGWPNVVHEAMACGAPIVATDVGALTDMVPSQEYGYVVPFNEPEQLENALRSALSRSWDRSRITQLAHSRSWVQVAREVVEEMQQVVSGKEAATDLPRSRK
jgi:teichuronic acid biosynthesis glycosyltransferase TuaC